MVAVLKREQRNVSLSAMFKHLFIIMDWKNYLNHSNMNFYCNFTYQNIKEQKSYKAHVDGHEILNRNPENGLAKV